MKTRSLASILALLALFVLAPGLVGNSAAQVTVQFGNEWYQGHRGQWQREGNSWRWESRDGNDWYQGREGSWYQEPDWRYRTNDGDEYRNGWQWYDRYGNYHQSYQHGPHNTQ
jgi:hypothetical protein